MYGKIFILGGEQISPDVYTREYWVDEDHQFLGYCDDGPPRKMPVITGNWLPPDITLDTTTKTIHIMPQGTAVAMQQLYDYLKQQQRGGVWK